MSGVAEGRREADEEGVAELSMGGRKAGTLLKGVLSGVAELCVAAAIDVVPRRGLGPRCGRCDWVAETGAVTLDGEENTPGSTREEVGLSTAW